MKTTTIVGGHIPTEISTKHQEQESSERCNQEVIPVGGAPTAQPRQRRKRRRPQQAKNARVPRVRPFSPCPNVVVVAGERVFEVFVLAVLQRPLQSRVEALVVRLEGRAPGTLVRRYHGMVSRYKAQRQLRQRGEWTRALYDEGGQLWTTLGQHLAERDHAWRWQLQTQTQLAVRCFWIANTRTRDDENSNFNSKYTVGLNGREVSGFKREPRQTGIALLIRDDNTREVSGFKSEPCETGTDFDPGRLQESTDGSQGNALADDETVTIRAARR